VFKSYDEYGALLLVLLRSQQMKYKKATILIIFLIVFFVLIRIFKPSFTVPFIDFVILLFLSFYLWSAVKTRLLKLTNTLRYIISIIFWLPIFTLFIASISLIFNKLDDWPSFLRVYFIGGLFTYIVALLIPVFFLFIADIIKWFQMLFSGRKKNNQRTDQLKRRAHYS